MYTGSPTHPGEIKPPGWGPYRNISSMGSPFQDAQNRALPGYTPRFGPSSWMTFDQYRPLDRLTGLLGNLFGGGGGQGAGGAGAGGGQGAGGFNFFDATGNRIGGVGPNSATANINPGAAWNPGIAAGAQGSLMSAAGQGQAAPSSAYSAGGPPTAADAAAQFGDARTGDALQSQNDLNLAGLEGQAGLDLSTQQALSGLMQGSQGLQNRMAGYGANEQLMGGALGNRQLQTQLGLLARLFGMGGGRGGRGGMSPFGPMISPFGIG